MRRQTGRSIRFITLLLRPHYGIVPLGSRVHVATFGIQCCYQGGIKAGRGKKWHCPLEQYHSDGNRQGLQGTSFCSNSEQKTGPSTQLQMVASYQRCGNHSLQMCHLTTRLLRWQMAAPSAQRKSPSVVTRTGWLSTPNSVPKFCFTCSHAD